MSHLQIQIIFVCWTIALIPLVVNLLIFLLTKLRIFQSPLSNQFRGVKLKVVSLLTIGGWIGFVSIPGGFGGAAAIAIMWFGALWHFNSKDSATTLIQNFWDHFAFIFLVAPAVTVIGVTLVMIVVGWDAISADQKPIKPS